MSLFIATLALGLGGLVLMAVPGVRRHGRTGHARVHAHARGHAAGATRSGAASHGGAPTHARGRGAAGRAAPAAHQVAAHVTADTLLRYMPEPHLVFSLLALFGAFGNVLLRTLHLPFWTSALGAAAIAVVLEWLIVGRLWRLALKFTGEPTSPLASLLMDEAEAVTAFHNGKGIVRAVLDGRAVQLTAELVAEESALPVRVGDRMTIQEVDADHQRVRVSVR